VTERKPYSAYRPALYDAIYVRRIRPCVVAAEIGLNSKAVWHHVRRLVRECGEPPPCQCGRPGAHDGICNGHNAENNPRCPHCDGTSKKCGRAEMADGWKEQRYRCRSCGASFCRSPKKVAKFDDYEGRVYDMIWHQGEKQEYVATVLGVHVSSVQSWVRLLKVKYGSPYAKANRESGRKAAA